MPSTELLNWIKESENFLMGEREGSRIQGKLVLLANEFKDNSDFFQWNKLEGKKQNIYQCLNMMQ